MALSGSHPGTAVGGLSLRIDWSATQSISNNTSTITANAYVVIASGWSIQIGSRTGVITIDGTNTTITYNLGLKGAGTHHIGTASKTITHNADGTKSFAISGSARIEATITGYGWIGTLYKGSNTYTLDTIARASQPTLNVSTQALGSAITISTNRASTSFTHTLTYSFGNQSGTIATGVATSQGLTLPVGLASAIPNTTSGTGTITCTTYNGGTLIGSKSVSFTATVPNNATFQPTATISSIVQGTTLPSGITVFVQNQSTAKVTSTGTPKYSATIKTYSVSVANIGTYTGSVITSGVLRNGGSVRVTLTVTDSRGLKGSTYQDIIVEPYSPPKISTLNASRSPNNESTDLSASINFEIAPVSNQNYKRYLLSYREATGSNVTVMDSTNFYSRTYTHELLDVLNLDKSYEVELTVYDSFTSVTRTVQVGTGFSLLNFNTSGKGMAIGKVSESDSFEVGMPMKAYQPITDGTTNNPYLYKSSATTINTFENGWEGTLFLSRYGDLVSIKGSFSKTGTTTNGTQLSVIPSDFRPHTLTPIAVAKGNVSPYNSSLVFWLTAGGSLVVRTSDSIPANLSSAGLSINQIYSV